MTAMIDPFTLAAPAPQPAPGLFTLLREDVACVFQRDPAARSTWEIGRAHV